MLRDASLRATAVSALSDIATSAHYAKSAVKTKKLDEMVAHGALTALVELPVVQTEDYFAHVSEIIEHIMENNEVRRQAVVASGAVDFFVSVYRDQADTVAKYFLVKFVSPSCYASAPSILPPPPFSRGWVRLFLVCRSRSRSDALLTRTYD